MRTVGRKIRPGERRRFKCDRCGTLWDKRDLCRDGEGMWVCPQEGPGLDGATLSRGNAEALRSYVQRLKPAVERVGRYGDPGVHPTPVRTGYITTELHQPLRTEDGVFLALDNTPTVETFMVLSTETGAGITSEAGVPLEG
jgi:predicted RNA-binding Zn-ribbon protein involved in translation (DUF1610 family)